MKKVVDAKELLSSYLDGKKIEYNSSYNYDYHFKVDHIDFLLFSILQRFDESEYSVTKYDGSMYITVY